MQVWLLIIFNHEAGMGQRVLRSRSQDDQYGQHRDRGCQALEVTSKLHLGGYP